VTSKLKWSKTRLLLYVGFAYLITLIFEDQVFGTQYATWIWGAVFIIWGLWQWFRTRLVFYAIFGFLCGLGAWHYQLAAHGDTIFSMLTFLLHLNVIILLAFLWGEKVFDRQDTLERNARRIFERAAANVNDAADGFTGRPYAGGKADYSVAEIESFARFMQASDLTVTRTENSKVILTFSLTTSPLTKQPLDKVNFVSFDSDGNIAVQISRKDYRQYKEQLTFDQLCASLAELFKRFLQYYREGKENQILVELGK